MSKKTIIKLYGTILLSCIILITVSCSTDDQDIIPSKEESSNAKSMTLAASTPIAYYSTPSNGNTVPNSSLNILINGVWAPIGASLTYNPNTKTITPPSGYGIDGWLRNP